MPHKNVHLEPGDVLLFEMLVSELDATYLKIDETFQDAGIDQFDSKEPFICAKQKTTASNTGTLWSYLKLIKVELSPVAFDLMSPSVKVCGEKQSQSPDCVVYNGDWGFENIATQKHRAKRVYDGGEIYFYMLMVLKMYMFEDEVVCVWCSIFKSDEQFLDVYVQEMSWFTSQKLTSHRISSTSGETGSLTRLCVRLKPKSFRASVPVVKVEAGVMTNYAMDCYRGVLGEANEVTENC